MEIEPARKSAVAEWAIVAEPQAVEVTESAKVEVPTQPGVSTQLEVPSAQDRVEVRQSDSPSILMLTSRVAESSSTTKLLSEKALVTDVSLVQVSSSSFEEHVDYLGDELGFSDELVPSDTTKHSHIFKEEIQVDVPVTVPPSGEVTTTEGISSIPPVFFFI